MCYGPDCPTDATRYVPDSSKEVLIYIFYYPFYYLPSYMLNQAIWIYDYIIISGDKTKKRSDIPQSESLGVILGIPLSIIGAFYLFVLSIILGIVLTIFSIIFAIFLFLLIIVLGIGGFVLYLFLTFRKTDQFEDVLL